MSSATVKNGNAASLVPLLPNGLTVPASQPHQRLKNGQAGGPPDLNGNANQPQASPIANGHRNGGFNSSLDTSKDDSFTDIDVESVDNPKELSGGTSERPPLNNVTTNVNNKSSNGVGNGKSIDNGHPAGSANVAGAPQGASAVPQTAAAALINSAEKEEDAKDWSPYFLGDMPLATWLLAVKKYVLTPLIRHPRSLAFRKPVDAKALGIFPIYNQVITRPMDLGTVKDKVEKKLYNSKAVVLNDVDLVWNNALRFNPTGHEVHEAAAFLQKHTLGHCLKAMVASGGSLTSATAAAAPQHTPVRATGIREARKKAPLGLPGEYDDLKPQHLEQKYAANLSPPLKACDGILRSLMLSRPHWEFVEPFMKTARPGGMCFGVIQDRMRSYHYTLSTEFANDVRRIVTETYRHAVNPEEDFKCKQAGKLLVEFERQFAANVKNDDEAAQTRAWAIQADPFIQKLVSAQDLIVSMNTGVDRLVQDYEVLKVVIKARKEADRKGAPKRRRAPEQAATPAAASASAPRKRAPSGSPAKKPAAKRAKTSPTSRAPKQQQQQKQQKPKQQQQPQYHQSALNAVSKKPTPEQIGAWIGMLEDSKQENLLEILRTNGENIEVDADGSVELSLETWSQKTLDEVELFLRREIPSEQSQQQQKQQQEHNSSKAGDSSSSDSSSSDSESSSSDSSDEDE